MVYDQLVVNMFAWSDSKLDLSTLIVVNGQILRNNLAIWSHWLALKLHFMLYMPASEVVTYDCWAFISLDTDYIVDHRSHFWDSSSYFEEQISSLPKAENTNLSRSGFDQTSKTVANWI